MKTKQSKYTVYHSITIYRNEIIFRVFFQLYLLYLHIEKYPLINKNFSSPIKGMRDKIEHDKSFHISSILLFIAYYLDIEIVEVYILQTQKK